MKGGERNAQSDHYGSSPNRTQYLDGDRVETLLLDKTGHVDYDFESFNIVKASLMKAERINPDLKYSLIQ